MKQNERLLVYAVTGFLALILLVAVVFGRAPDNKVAIKTGATKAGATPALDDIIGDVGVRTPPGTNPALANGGAPNGAANNSGLPSPGQVATEQPLMAQPKPMVAADLVSQSLGLSRRERNVRFVRAKSGDSMESLVRRWCGARDPFLAEAQSLNEELVLLRVGQEVALPWVDDEVLALAIEQQKPKTLLAAETNGSSGKTAADASLAGGLSPTVPAFELPGTNPPLGTAAPRGEVPVPSVGRPDVAAANYTVKKGESLWRIAERTYGRKNADRMIVAIKAANPGLTDNVREGQKIALPKAEAAPAK